jgi:hypothetical protein
MEWSGLMLAAMAACAPAPALAWGDEGHRIIALVAYRHLTPAVRVKADQLLAGDADPLTAPDIASRATWADKFRDSDRYTSQRRYRLTREWHSVDIELDEPDLAAACFGHPAASIPASEIAAFATELHDLSPSAPERPIAFTFVLHLVGDVHQPLHAADHHDAAGNGACSLLWPTPSWCDVCRR